jgi:hypothetical protein
MHASTNRSLQQRKSRHLILPDGELLGESRRIERIEGLFDKSYSAEQEYKSLDPANSRFRNRWRDLCLRRSRDNKTAIELFLTGLEVWEVGLRRRIDDGKSNLQ